MKTTMIVLVSVSAAVVIAWANPSPAREPQKPADRSLKPAAAKTEKSKDGNLLPNGNLEVGKVTPVRWQTIDGLSSFWVKDSDPRRGRVLMFDSDVLQSQAYDWWLKIDDGASPLKAPKRIPTTAPKFDTLAGLDGVWFWSHPIPIKKGQKFWLTLDVKGGGILVWLVGYPKKPSVSFGADAGAVQQYFSKRRGTAPPNKRNRKAFIHKYKWRGQMRAGGSKDWKTYSRRNKPFQPTKYTPSVRWVRVLLYPFWPPGKYFVDNVRLVEYDPKIHGEKASAR
ncbi:MAG: hypothetical protein QF363_05340 [Planctomycetaceae bacterium]|jgi:hypothetical protein|nr:hypothetical protein [Planctomycetaceae bacterium]